MNKGESPKISHKNQKFFRKLKKILSSEDAKDLYILVSIVGSQECLSEKKLLKTFHDKAKDNIYSSWMDKGSNTHNPLNGKVYGGQFHRIFHGHDFIANIMPFIRKFGIKKTPHFLYERIIDSFTINGLPISGVQFLAKNGINKNILKDYGTLNIGDSSAGFIALFDSCRFFEQYKNGFESKDLAKGSIRVVFKISYGVWRKNPLLIASGVIDSAVLSTWFFKTGEQIKQDQSWLRNQYKKSFNQCSRIKNEITLLQSKWEKDKKQQKEINSLFNEAIN